MSVFDQFCEYVQHSIFSEENMGSVVAFIVDQTYIDNACRKIGVKENALMRAVKNSLWIEPTDVQIMGLLAIQLYAASKKANADGITKKNYRDRLVQVLDWDIDSLQEWMGCYQDRYWKRLYNWCDNRGFIIAKTYPKYCTGRYVQYPEQQAERVFTEEELLYIAEYFYDEALQPNEDIVENSFWKIIKKSRLSQYVHTSHAQGILYSQDYIKDGYTQIYNFYLRWDGTYLTYDYYRRKKSEKKSESLFNLFLSTKDNCIDIRDNDSNRQCCFAFSEILQSKIEQYYHFKRKGLILFKKNELYDEYWDETRFLEGNEDGVGIIFITSSRFNYLVGCDALYSNNFIRIVKITRNYHTESLYTDPRYYSLEGGLKVGNHKYILGAPPLLKIERKTKYWIDGIAYETQEGYEYYRLSNMTLGKHYVKFPNFPKLEFEIVNSDSSDNTWDPNYNKWIINKKEKSWSSGKVAEGITGLDFSSIKLRDDKLSANVLTAWARSHSFHQIPESNNIVLKLLKNK